MNRLCKYTFSRTAAFYLALSLCSMAISAQEHQVTTRTTDGVTVFGQTYYSNLDKTTPLILLFHQGGSNGRGEYSDIIPHFNRAGFRAIAWDQRSGGETYGNINRTVSELGDSVAKGYCDAYPDLVAALEFVKQNELADKVVVLGSSYSASLVVRLAAEHQDSVSGVVSFSPASGGPMADCRARKWINNLNQPFLVFRPESEMSRESSQQQKVILTAAGAEFKVIEHGVHGASSLLDSRTGHPMQGAREMLFTWIKKVNEKSD